MQALALNLKQSATKPQLLSLDFGNFELKAFDGHTLIRSRSLQTPLAQGQRAKEATEDSPIIEMNGQRWHVGSQARRYRNVEVTAQADKSQLAQLHLAACIAHGGEYNLVVSHHSPDEYRDGLTAALLGTHVYTRNGQLITATVRNVAVIAEASGTYQLAKLRSYVPQRGLTVVIDLGGSTWISSLYSSTGERLDHTAHEREGTYALASEIAKDDRLAAPLREHYSVSSPNPSIILDGFTSGHYYGDSDLHWDVWLSEYLDPWFKGIVQTIKAQYQAELPNVRRFLVTGGGSHLISHKVAASPAFLVMPEANTASVQGAYLAAQSRIAA